MSDVDERSAAMLGSQPVAYAVEFAGDDAPFMLTFDKGRAVAETGGVGVVVPLYRSPTLTDDEREAIERVAKHCADTSCVDTARTLWGLLHRLGY